MKFILKKLISEYSLRQAFRNVNKSLMLYVKKEMCIVTRLFYHKIVMLLAFAPSLWQQRQGSL